MSLLMTRKTLHVTAPESELQHRLQALWPEIDAMRNALYVHYSDAEQDQFSTAIRKFGIYLPDQAIPLDMRQWMDDLEHRRPSITQDALLQEVNSYINTRIKNVSDIYTSGRKEYYASPQITLQRGKGDCEDFAYLKAAILKKMGFTDDQLIIIEGQTPAALEGTSGGHIALLVNTQDGLRLMDNYYFPKVESPPQKVMEHLDNCYSSDFKIFCSIPKAGPSR